MLKSKNPSVPVKHANQRGELPRERMAGGPVVDHETNLRFKTWTGGGDRPSIGEVIDRLTHHALETGFNPSLPIVPNLKPRK